MKSPGAHGNEASRPNALTILAIGIISYILANIIHEGFGHGMACWAVSGHARLWTAVDFDCDCADLAQWKFRLMSLAGAAANFIAACGFYVALRRSRASVFFRYFYWLSAAVNVFQFGGYLMFLYPFGKGDGAAFADSGLLTKIGFFAIGAIAYLAGMILTRGRIEPFLKGAESRRKSLHLLTLIPYLGGGASICLGSIFNPGGLHPAFDYAAASTFIGTFGLLQLYVDTSAKSDESSSTIARESIGWILAGTVLLVAYVWFLGPGIVLGPGR